MKLIDADALMKAFYKSIDDAVLHGGKIVPFQDIIQNAPTIDAVPHWIPCGEKLPEPTQEVLVTEINGCVYTSRIVHGEFEYGGNVIAWMPLPEPYNGERKDDD